MKYLGVDYGKKKIGLAVSEGELVSGLGSIRVSSLKEAVTRIDEVIKKEEVGKIIMGLAESGQSRKMVKRFVKEAKETTGFEGIEIIEVDETLSTHRAQVEIRELGGGDEDERAAMIILENYLEGVK